MHPLIGPVLGNTSVELHVLHISASPSSASPECRFGDTTPVMGTVVVSEANTLRCTTPPMGAAGMVPLTISLNEQDFHTVMNFSFFTASLQTMRVQPAGGPVAGGTEVRLGAAGGSAEAPPAGLTRCRFGRAVVNASIDEGGQIHCAAPSGLEAAASRVWSSDEVCV